MHTLVYSMKDATFLVPCFNCRFKERFTWHHMCVLEIYRRYLFNFRVPSIASYRLPAIVLLGDQLWLVWRLPIVVPCSQWLAVDVWFLFFFFSIIPSFTRGRMFDLRFPVVFRLSFRDCSLAMRVSLPQRTMNVWNQVGWMADDVLLHSIQDSEDQRGDKKRTTW